MTLRDQRLQPLALPDCDPLVEPFVGAKRLVPQQQRVEIAAEGGQGRAEIVGHPGDKVAPGGLGT